MMYIINFISEYFIKFHTIQGGIGVELGVALISSAVCTFLTVAYFKTKRFIGGTKKA